ncbi:MAG: proton-conducting transporter membrane subunit [Dehalococcoidia bacterium]|nr:proton-conducting transporter membrane subunit [Dehalococcoidia bacterium]
MRLLVLIGLPFAAAVLSQAFGKVRIRATTLSLCLLFAEFYILRGVGSQYAFSFGTMTLTVSPLAHFLFSLIIGLVGIIVLYSYGMRSDHLTAAAFVVLGGIAAILLLNNLILITLLIEIIGVGIVLFVGGPRVTKGGVNSATKYLAAAIIASVCLVFAFLLVDYYRLSSENALLARLVLALLVVGFGIRLAGFPFHFWLPDFSHNSPPMVTALLVSLLSLAVLAFLIVVLRTFPWLLDSDEARNLLTTGGMIGALLGAAIALGQPSINRVLAYSAVSEMGVIVFGIGTVSSLGLVGAVFEAVTMSVGMLLLLMSAGVVIRCCGNTDLARLGGLASRLPVATIGFIAGGLSIAGFPPFGGFASRWVLLSAARQAQGAISIWIIGVGLLLTLAYSRALRQAFLGEEVGKRVGSEAFVPSVAIIVLILVVLGLGLYPAPVFDHINAALAGISLIKSG